MQNIDDIDFASLNAVLQNLFGKENILPKESVESLDIENIAEKLKDIVKEIYEERHKEAKKQNAEDIICKIERHLILKVVNENWMDHIDQIAALKDGIGLRAYGQTNPLEAYKIESFDMFENLVDTIQEEATRAVFSIRPREDNKLNDNIVNKNTLNVTNISTNAGGNVATKREPVKASKKIGRNEPCPCR